MTSAYPGFCANPSSAVVATSRSGPPSPLMSATTMELGVGMMGGGFGVLLSSWQPERVPNATANPARAAWEERVPTRFRSECIFTAGTSVHYFALIFCKRVPGAAVYGASPSRPRRTAYTASAAAVYGITGYGRPWGTLHR